MGSTPVIGAPALSARVRVHSLDIFRGLTMAVMIFVNDLAGVKGLPWWTYHMPSKQSGMTYVDVVFPAFLFIVGMSIPFAVERRLERGDSWLRLWTHILLRSFSLIVLGLILANAGKPDPQLTGLPAGAWATLALVGGILFWLVYPSTGRRGLWLALKYSGLVLLIVALAIFRRSTPNGGTAWLDFRYWEILGLIGRVYLAACILYIPFRKLRWAPAALLAALTALNVASRMGMTPLQRLFPYALWPFDSGELPSIAIAGVLAHQIFFDDRGPAAPFRRKAMLAAAYAAALLAGGWAFTFLGISKNAATPAWCLYSCGASVALFLAIYWIADVRGHRAWAAFAAPAGSNTLLTYLLPDLFYFTLGGVYSAWTPHAGWPGVIRSVLFTACMLAISWVLTRWKIRMHL